MRNPTYFSCPKISISKIIGREQWVEDVSTSSALDNNDVAISVLCAMTCTTAISYLIETHHLSASFTTRYISSHLQSPFLYANPARATVKKKVTIN